MATTFKKYFLQNASAFMHGKEFEPYMHTDVLTAFDRLDEDTIWAMACTIYIDGEDIGLAVFDKDIQKLVAGSEAFDKKMGIEQEIPVDKLLQLYDDLDVEAKTYFWNGLAKLYTIVHRAMCAIAGSTTESEK